MSPALLVPGCFGKLPIAADFISHHTRSAEALALERWLQDGVGLARGRLGPRADPLLRHLPPVNFLFRQTRKGGLLLGSLGPGRDRSGRLFPFAVFLQVAAEHASGDWGAYPELFAEFFEQAVVVARGSAPDLPRLIEEVEGLGSSLPGPEALTDRLRRSLEESSLASKSVGMLESSTVLTKTRDADPSTQSLVSSIARNLAVVAQRFPAQSHPRFEFGLRFPLPAAGAARAAALTFWLELVPRILSDTAGPPWLFWTGPDAASRSCLDLYFQPPGTLAFLHLLDLEMTSDGLYPVHEHTVSSEPRAPGWTAALERMSDPSLSLAEAIRSLRPSPPGIVGPTEAKTGPNP